MEQLQQVATVIALSMGVAWASGINLYASILVLGLLGASGNMALPESLQILQNPLVIGVAGLMYFLEFFADKVPGVDTGWDTIHTFIRIPAGAVLAASALGEVDPAISLAVALIGGGVAAGTHLTKASTRLLVNVSPEPFSNIGISLAEDVAVIGGLWVALHHPVLFLALLGLFILFMVWFLPVLWRGVKHLFGAIRRQFGVRSEV